jgi:hypothetical protein
MKSLEGTKYHIVAHSHGGSVVWHGLVESKRRGIDLSGLRSWTTVGTPFLKYSATDITFGNHRSSDFRGDFNSSLPSSMEWSDQLL